MLEELKGFLKSYKLSARAEEERLGKLNEAKGEFVRNLLFEFTKHLDALAGDRGYYRERLAKLEATCEQLLSWSPGQLELRSSETKTDLLDDESLYIEIFELFLSEGYDI